MALDERPSFSLLRRHLLLAFSTTALSVRPGVAAALRPRLMLANAMPDDIVLADYWVSEKYDGIRAYWDGRRLLTRGGQIIHAPRWFTLGWPRTAFDGELWAGPGTFEKTVSTVRRQQPVERDWRAIHYMVFDVPQQQERFDRRLSVLFQQVTCLNQSWVEPVRQQRVASRALLQRLLAEVERRGGEGLMLHRSDSLYRAGRSDDLFKFKSMDDAEAMVIDYLPGRGKYTGLVGALKVQGPDGMRFNLGSGLDDATRRNPPPLGSMVTYRYRGRHPSGKPRFAVLLRLHAE
jgi:DNA ligase-1